ncbi:hypothetical protein AOQ84DRAFT_339513 [Glonium stellatum]|uniref:Uncharacterized protein n=1 Tax=Glonium stellatum TaxID=574774 RepID=A0A8E2F2E0_9PEZI|nr:hypothetical protein AOQ84DRAFT_339513 [Glonium stellatum]
MSTREKHSFVHCFQKSISSLAQYIYAIDPDFQNLLNSLGRLPTELLSNIADLSWPCAVQQPLIVMTETEPTEKCLQVYGKKPGPGLNYLEFPGTDVSFDRLVLSGTSYIAKIYQTDSASCGNIPRSIIIARDDVGITKVDFYVDSEQRVLHQTSGRGYWYKIIRPTTQRYKLRVHSQYLLITNISLVHNDGETDWDVFWDHPFPPSSLPWTWYTLENGGPPPEFMRYVKLDDSTSGVTLSCKSGGTVSIHTHSKLFGQNAEFYEGIESKVSKGLVWIYFPLAPEETIAAGWIRELSSTLNDRRPVIVISTSQQRTRSFGPYVHLDCRSYYRFQSLGSQIGHRVTGFCYNDMGIAASTRFQFTLGHASGKTTRCMNLKPSFGPIANIVECSAILDWFYSYALLEGVTCIRVCPHRPCIGVILVYSGREETLGQWRFDRDIEKITPSGPIYLCMDKTEIGPFVKGIVGEKPSEEGDWREINVTDTISWWFTSECSQVVIEDVLA